MSGADIALVVGSVATLVTALGGILIILVRLAEVHTLVNRSSEEAKERNAQLIQTLMTHGIKVPTDPNLTATGE